MTSLERNIRRSLAEGNWLITSHAEDRLAEREIEVWQVIEASVAGQTIEVDAKAVPNPKVLIEGNLADGTTIVAVWAWLKSVRRATLVTVYFPDA